MKSINGEFSVETHVHFGRFCTSHNGVKNENSEHKRNNTSNNGMD